MMEQIVGLKSHFELHIEGFEDPRAMMLPLQLLHRSVYSRIPDLSIREGATRRSHIPELDDEV